jgi:type II secretory ATPase GspE/PulE/Tfp pilus assembly ATPase PilB-like protein
LVMSTLHVTSVFGVVPRLRPFGLMPQVIAENLKLVINQRLVRRVCEFCAEDVLFTQSECNWLGTTLGTMGKKGKGCLRCRGTGFHGRLPLYELLFVDEEIANAIADDVGRETIRSLVASRGFRSIAEISKRRVLLGQTTAVEVYRTIGEGPSE